MFIDFQRFSQGYLTTYLLFYFSIFNQNSQPQIIAFQDVLGPSNLYSKELLWERKQRIVYANKNFHNCENILLYKLIYSYTCGWRVALILTNCNEGWESNFLKIILKVFIKPVSELLLNRVTQPVWPNVVEQCRLPDNFEPGK